MRVEQGKGTRMNLIGFEDEGVRLHDTEQRIEMVTDCTICNLRQNRTVTDKPYTRPVTHAVSYLQGYSASTIKMLQNHAGKKT